MKSSIVATLLFSALTLFAVSCGKAVPQNRGDSSPPEVKVIKAHIESLPLIQELVGRLAATRVAEVRARVAGIVLRRDYQEGTDVKEGQSLFLIDPAPLKAELLAQEASLAKAQADAANAAITAKRYRDLAAKNLLSSQDLDTALANERSTAAAVNEAKALVEKARLNLSYTKVTAPIRGRAGRALVTEGALVGKDEATQLTTIEQLDSVYVDFSLPVTEFMKLRKLNDGPSPESRSLPVEVVLPDGHVHSQEGRLDFSDAAADPGTGSVALRALVPNPEMHLLPGMFVKLKFTLGRLDQALLLPQAVVARDGKGAYVLVVDEQGRVEQRRITTHGMTHSEWIVTGDLKEGEQIILEGLQKVAPGKSAKAVPAGTSEG